jgi:hypothetical protein
MTNTRLPAAPNTPLMDSSIKTPSSWMRWVAIAGLVMLVAVQAINIIGPQTISPEICLGWLEAHTNQSVVQTLAAFVQYKTFFYRPVEHVLIHFFFQIVDAHNFRLIKAVSFCVILANGYVATVLARRLFSAGLIESIATFALIVSHPLYYETAYEGSGITDPVFDLALNGFLICFLLLLQAANPKLGNPVRLSSTQSCTLAAVCCLLVVATVTSQERGLAIFPMAGLLYLYFHSSPRVTGHPRPTFYASIVLLFCLIAFCVYVIFVAANKGPITGNHYRDDFELRFVLLNLGKALEMPLRLLTFNTGFSYDVHDAFEFNLFALPLIASLLAYVVQVFRSVDTIEKHRLAIVAILYLSALPIPVLFGAAPWHFYTAAVYASIATGRSVWYWLQRVDRRLGTGLIVVFFLGLTFETVRSIDAELQPGNFQGDFMSLVPRALEDKTLNDVSHVPQAVYFDTGSYGEFIWPFGGAGNLFKYLYRDPNIIEVALVHGKVFEPDLCPRIAGMRTLSFALDVERETWHKINARPCEYPRTAAGH